MTLGKYLANNSGTITEVAANQTSAGAGDADKLVALNSAGVLDVTMMPRHRRRHCDDLGLRILGGRGAL
jgi:hypothetical protein